MNKSFVLIIGIALIGCGHNTTEEINSDALQSNAVVEKETVVKTKAKAIETVKIVKFFDFKCPFCQRGNKTLIDLKAKYQDQIEIQYRHYPNYSGSREIASASECARDQGQFDAFRNEYFDNFFGRHGTGVMETIASNIELDIEPFQTCLSSDIKRTVIEQHLKEAQQIGVSAVPFFIVGGQPLVGAYPQDVFESLIDRELNASQ